MNDDASNDTPLILSNGKLKPVSRRQKIIQWLYGVGEPYLLRYADYMMRTERRRQRYVKKQKPDAIPRCVIISTEAACRFVDFIYNREDGNSSARMAVTDCVCQTALKKHREPRRKDMALLYAADMYTTMDHTGIKEDFEPIESAEKAKDMLRHFADCGLLHNVLYCNSSGKWAFVMCNCDDEICVPFRSYMAGRTDEFGAGPEIIRYEEDKCVGIDQCGKCLDRCILQACGISGNRSTVIPGACLGCGLCVSTCTGKARRLVPRKNYVHEDILTTRILLGDQATGTEDTN